MLLGKPFIGSEEDNPVQFFLSAMLFHIIAVLQDIGMHEEGFARSGGHPEGELIHILRRIGGICKTLNAVRFFQILIDPIHLSRDVGTEFFGVRKIAVQVYLGKEQG